MSGKSSTGQLEGSAIVRRLDVPELQDLIGVGGHVMQLDFFVEVAPVTGSNHIGRYEFVVLRTAHFRLLSPSRRARSAVVEFL
jgi:hypothetical protein